MEPQIVYRIWHEPLPPAAVTQGTAAVELDYSPPRESGDDNVIRVPPHDGPLGPITIKLPFRCNRAVVMMRGFKMFFLDQQPHKVEHISAGISRPASGSLPTPGIFETEPGGKITLVPEGELSSGEADGFRMLIYYLLLAWDSEQMELLPVSGFQGDIQDSPGLLSSKITVQDPCQPPGSAPLGSDVAERCGPLFGGLQGFNFWARREAQEVESLWLSTGQVGGGNCVFEESSRRGFVPTTIIELPSLQRGNLGTIDWEFCTGLFDVTRTFRAVQGTVLAGRSVRLSTAGTTSLNLPGHFGHRDPDQPFSVTLDTPELAFPLSADMAFLSLGMFAFKPKGKIRELEIEVHGIEYDGELIKWQYGGGISVSPPITGGLGSSRKRFLIGRPAFGGVVRKTAVADTRLAVQHLRFDNGVRGALSLEPDQYGAIRNTGNMPLLLTRAERRGPQADEFNFLLDYRGDIFRPHELVDRAPLVLNPSETLLIGGRFFPQVEAGPNDPPRIAWVDFVTNSPKFDILRVGATGRTIPEQPHGAVLPEALFFGFVNINASNHPLGFPARRVFLISNGQTPLLIQSLDLDDPTLGFSFGIQDLGTLEPEPVTSGVLYQIEEGDTIVIEVRFVPTGVGPAETKLVALTNAGRLETRLLDDGVS